jgi:hypothetical protein
LRAWQTLRHLRELASRTGKLSRLLVFGSFVTAKPSPEDVDVVLVMEQDFRFELVPREVRTLFSHAEAQARFGASVFWLREGMLTPALMDEFLAAWQTTRNGARRGIVEIVK